MHATTRHSPTTPGLKGFDFSPRTRVIFGEDSIERVGELARELGAKHVLLVTDKGIVAAGHPARAVGFIEGAGLYVTIFDEVRENPTTVDVDRCVEVARQAGIDLIVGLGGGSSMDTAKGTNFILTNGGQMKDYWGVGKATKPMLPMIAIPTTAGTGSECQSFALISDDQTHLKMACGDPKAAAKVAILDPLLTISQPPRVTACTGIDTLVHAVETAVTKKRTSVSAIYSREAFRLCLGGLERVLRDPQDLEARGMMQLSAAFAGTAIENSMLGAAHSAANPLTARFGVVHGQAVGLMLPAVIGFNARDPLAHERYMELSDAADLGPIEEFVAELEVLLDVAKMREGLSQYKIDHKQFPSLAREAAQQWTANFNPRTIAAEDFERLYEEVFG
ncbi:iron-containing alcohol dehydrogenase [Chthoniobacter flavus Ellin428]|uniref:Iron-containing alcohol dehydrogenase n=1 Tax=Chthoniobacter flavus Ellin428 TaxID=497964 RepID=B4D7Z7_9BACT|nr:iron-containing alcohol dehydrogenase [Chthoniobacter flavus]EDY17520.1 iron-containing alcohol dehydrogenase [Chthoniobacter flavus Ellin428]TCO92314.1 alcohol dehydrogenase/alcohol dehydrogenase [Chthoniobacter flavus]